MVFDDLGPGTTAFSHLSCLNVRRNQDEKILSGSS